MILLKAPHCHGFNRFLDLNTITIYLIWYVSPIKTLGKFTIPRLVYIAIVYVRSAGCWHCTESLVVHVIQQCHNTYNADKNQQ